MSITTIRREYEAGKFTTDIFVNGRLVVNAVGDAMVDTIVSRLRGIVARK